MPKGSSMSAAGCGTGTSDTILGAAPLAKLLVSTSPNPVKDIIAAAGSDGGVAGVAARSVDDPSSSLSINLAR